MPKMEFMLPPLPYPYNALEPVISKETLMLHHDKHHKAYVDKTNDALAKLDILRGKDTLIEYKTESEKLDFNLNGHLLHRLYWQNMRSPNPDGFNDPLDEVGNRLSEFFGTFQRFQDEFTEAANTVEGSGWAVLFKSEDQNLFIAQIEKHQNGHFVGMTPVLVLDVWEHAYYLDYKNDRAKYINEWWKIVNWVDVQERL